MSILQKIYQHCHSPFRGLGGFCNSPFRGSGGLSLLCFLLLLCSCSSFEYRYVEGYIWGTTYHITYKADASLNDSIEQVMKAVNMSLSPFQEGSTVSKINANEDLCADAMVRDVFALSQDMCRISDGAFDPTVAPLINLWGFGYKQHMQQPKAAQVDSAMAFVGILQCCILDDGTVSKKSPQTEFDFSAIAKGYGVDRIAEMMQRNGCSDYMIEVGGEMALSGHNPRGEEWHVQIDAPVPEYGGSVKHNKLAIIPLTDCCIATSGNYRNFRQAPDGTIYGHTIDTKTGYPSETDMLSASIIAPSCAQADALATASMAMNADDAQSMLAGFDDAKWMLVVSAGDSIVVLKNFD